jgi:ketosteroid isomerase-like protein
MPFTGRLDDRQLIRERYDAYSDAVFRADTEDYLACWTEDGVRSGVGGDCTGRAELRAHWDGMWRVIDRMTFFTQVASIEVEGERDRAIARAFCLEMLTFRTGDTQQVVGRYDDVLRRVDDAWLFARRHYDVAMAPTAE